MAHRRAPKNTAPASPRAGVRAQAPLTPEAVAAHFPPGLAAETPAPLLAALPERLGRYLDLLCAWNGAINLTGGRDRADILTRLIPDSFHLAAFLRSAPLTATALGAGAPRVWDLGAGAGLPGIPLRMVWERGDYTLVEVREKRALFLANALAALGLPRTGVFRGAAERLFAAEPPGGDAGADCIVSRAFLPWPKLLDFCRPALRPGGVIIIFASAPCGDLPAPWRSVSQADYSVAGSRRWLWALGRQPGAEAAHD